MGRNVRIVALAIFALFLCSPVPALAEDWRVASYSGEPIKTVWFIDADTMRFSNNEVRFWMDTRSRNVDQFGGNRVLELVHANCGDLSYEGLQTETYFAGTPLINMGTMSPEFAAPGTVIGGILSRICAGNYSTPIANKNNPDFVTKEFFGSQWFKRPVKAKSRRKHYYP